MGKRNCKSKWKYINNKIGPKFIAFNIYMENLSKQSNLLFMDSNRETYTLINKVLKATITTYMNKNSILSSKHTKGSF